MFVQAADREVKAASRSICGSSILGISRSEKGAAAERFCAAAGDDKAGEERGAAVRGGGKAGTSLEISPTGGSSKGRL